MPGFNISERRIMSLLNKLKSLVFTEQSSPEEPAEEPSSPVGPSKTVEELSSTRDEGNFIAIENIVESLPSDISEESHQAFRSIGAAPRKFDSSAMMADVDPARLEIAKKCRMMEREIAGAVAEETIRRFKYSPSSRGKCYTQNHL